MEKPWFSRLFRRSPTEQLKSTQVKADEGDADAQFRLGLNFANGEGPAQDYAQALQWYLKAADQNHALAQFNLGIMFAEGHGMAPDDAQAVTWIQRAAQQGDAGAQHNMGMRQIRAGFKGRDDAVGSTESRLEAYKWFSLAAAQGYRGSGAIFEGLAIDMTREEAAEGNRRAKAFTFTNLNPIQN